MLCQGKNEKFIPGGFFSKDKKVLEECLNEAKGSGNYCEIHGCFDCSLKPVEACSEHDGVKLCLICTAKRVFKKSQEKEKQKKEEAEKVRLAEEARKKAEGDKRKQQQQEEETRERERERERANLIVQEIKTELNNSAVIITELDSKYHNYESLVLSELERIKNDLIEAIKNKRAEKKLANLLSQANNCSDDDLWKFIQELEKFVSAPALPYEKNAYSTHQNEVDAMLNKLRSRWKNLSEETKLANYWNNAIQNFDNWLNKAENLQLAADDPFANFKENIKEKKTQAAIANLEKEAYQHILTKFKEMVKQSLGAEQQSGEYHEIENGQNFEEVKLALNNIQQRRQNPDSPTLPNNNLPHIPIPNQPEQDKKKNGPKSKDPKNSLNHSNNLTSKIVIGTTTIIGGSLILVLTSMVVKNWKRRRKKKR